MELPTVPPVRWALDAPAADSAGGRFPLPGRHRFALALCVLGVFGLSLPLSLVGADSLTEKVRTAQRLETVKTLGEPRAFAKGNDLRLYYTNAAEGKELVFKAAWKRTPVEVWDYRYHAAVLRFDNTPPQLPSPASAWQEATVLGRERWAAFATVALERLAPTAPNHGLYFVTLDSEVVVFREAGGRIKAVAFDRKPEAVVIDRRLNAQEFTVALARAAETQLQSAHPGKTLFLVAQSTAPEGGFFLLDVAQRRCVLLSAPRGDVDPGGGFQLDTSVRSFVSLTVESHGFAILKNPVSSVGRLLNTVGQTVASLVGPGLHTASWPAPPPTNSAGMDLVAWEKRLDHLTKMPRERGSVRFLIDGENFFPVFERRIAEARQSVQLHVNIFDNDDVAVHVADLLRERSATIGVKVILDRMCSLVAATQPPGTPMPDGFVPPKSIGVYLEHGSHVRVRPFLNPWLTADHTKVFTIDGRYAYLGGMNIGREYRYEWHDLMAEVEGPILNHFERDFDRAWSHASALGDFAYAGQALLGKRPPPAVCDETRTWPELRRLYTRTGNTQIRRVELEACDWARERIYLENPYLFDRAILNALARARQRGVDVRVILPSDNDLAGARGSNLVIANYLLRNGVRVFVYPGMSHVKGLIVDGWTCFGSANFNKLSLRLNQEADLATSDPDIVERFRRELFEVDFAKSHELTQPLAVSWTDDLADTILSQF